MQDHYTLCVMHVGSPSCGMNAAVRSFVRNCIYRGDKVYGICDGVMGILAGKFKLMDWPSVTGWVAQGGAYLGTKRTVPTEDQMPLIAQKLKEFNIQAMLIIGGFEASFKQKNKFQPINKMKKLSTQFKPDDEGIFEIENFTFNFCFHSFSCLPLLTKCNFHDICNLNMIISNFLQGYQTGLSLCNARDKYPELRIPIAMIPATISNNVPGTEFSLGCDTALNEITEICDRIRQSAQGTKRRVFIIETMGGYCGYLATTAGLAGGADAAYIFEEKFNIKDLNQDIIAMAAKMSEGVQRGLILRNESANSNYNTDFMMRLFSEEGKGLFSCRMNIIGNLVILNWRLGYRCNDENVF